MGRKKVVDEDKLLLRLGQGATHQQIADELKCSRSAVTRAVRRLEQRNPELFKETSVVLFREDEPEHLATARMYIMNAVLPALQGLTSKQLTPEMIRKLLLAADKMLTMEKLIRGEATQLVGHGHIHKVDNEQMDELRKLSEQLSQQVVDQSVKQLEHVAEATENEFVEEGEITDVSETNE